MVNKKEFTVIIVTFNSMRWIEKCLSSIKDHDIIVVDNFSQDETVNYIKSNFPKISIIESNKNLGFAKANNLGINKAYKEGKDYFFLLNHDAWVQPGVIEGLIDLHKTNSNYGIISPIHLNGQGDLLDYNFTNYISNPKDEGRALLTELLVNKSCNPLYNVGFVNAAAWLVTRECVRKVGVFDDELFIHYGEDINYSQRIKYHNLKIGIATGFFIYHDREERFGLQKENFLTREKELEKFILKGANILDKDAVINMNQNLNSLKKTIIKQMFFFRFRKAAKMNEFYQEISSYYQKIILKREHYLQ